MNKVYDSTISSELKKMPQMLPKKDGFDAIMDQVHQHKRRHSLRIPALAAVILAVFTFWQLTSTNQTHVNQLEQLNLLTEKIAMIEYVVRNEVIKHSEPGSPILEKMVSMENWLDQLDQNITKTPDSSQKLELLHAKLEILNDLVALHKKYQPPTFKQMI